MTIGIGVLCSSKPKPHIPRPDSFVLMADTMGSTTTDSTSELHKMWINRELNLYAVGAGSLEYSGEIFAIIESEIDAIRKTNQPITHSLISTSLNKAFHILKSQHFQWDVMPQLFIATANGSLQLGNEQLVLNEWQKYGVNLHMLVGTFDCTGQAYLYKIGQFSDEYGFVPKTVFLSEFPGYATIGSGSANADFWLKYRDHVLWNSVERAAYHAFEAKKMAAKSPTVNDEIEIAVVTPEGGYHITKNNPEPSGCPVSLRELEGTFRRLGPRSTLAMEHKSKVKPLTSGKSAGQP